MGRAALKFDISQLPANIDVIEAKLSIRLDRIILTSAEPDGYDRDGTFKLHQITKEWSDSSTSWDDLADSFDSTPLDTAEYLRGSEKTWFEFDVTPQSAVGELANGFVLSIETTVPNTQSGTVVVFNSSEQSYRPYRPKLYIKYR